MERQLPEIVVCESDYERLVRLVQSHRASPVSEQLEAELDRAEIVEDDELPEGVVRMESRVGIEDVATGEGREVTLVYPSAADFEKGRLSVLAPVGAALLGLRAGQEIDWPLPGGRLKRVRVVSVG